jgi:hypothetical protein
MEPGAQLVHIRLPWPKTETFKLAMRNSFSEDFIERILDNRVAPNGQPITLDFIRNIFAIPEEDWAFIKDVLQPDPKIRFRSSADELLQNRYLC